MQPLDVVRVLGEQFPRQQGELKARAKVYVQVLEPLAGDQLRRAFDQTMAGWQKAAAPWPKDILQHAPSSATNAADLVAKTERAQIIARAMIDATLNWLTLEIRSRATDQHASAGEYNQALRVELEPAAWKIAAGCVKAGVHPPARMEVHESAWLNADNRVRSWSGLAARRAGSFKPLRQAAREIEAKPETTAA